MSLYKKDDILLVLLKEDNTKHIVKVIEVDSNDMRLTYKSTCLYANLNRFHNEWINNEYVDILRKATASDIEAFRKEHNIKFKIGDEVVYGRGTDVIEMFDIGDYEYLLENGGSWVDGEDLELVSNTVKNIIYEEGDELLVLLKKNNTKHIVKVSEVDIDDKNRTYCFEGLYSDRSEFNYFWFYNEDIEIIKKVTDSDIDDFCKEHNIAFRIGQKVLYDDETDSIIEYDLISNKYVLDGNDNLATEHQIELYSVGDTIIVVDFNDDEHILEIVSLSHQDSYYPCEVVCLYGSYSNFNNSLLDTREIKSIKKATNQDIESYIEYVGITKKVGDTVIYENKYHKISCYDSYDGQFLLADSDIWVSEYDLQDEIDLAYSIGDIILINDGDNHILEIVEIDEESDEPYKVKCLYGGYSDYNGKTISENDIDRLLDEDDIDVFLDEYLEVKHRIGKNVFYRGDKYLVLCYDSSDEKYMVQNCGFKKWLSKDDLLVSFKIDDLVKINGLSDTIAKVINVFDDGDIEVAILVGDSDGINTYYNTDDLELTTKQELDSLQKDFIIKIGDKVFFEGEQDTILAIDHINNIDKKYLLEDFDEWVDEDEISKTNKVFKIDDLVKVKGEPNAIYKIISNEDDEKEYEVDLVIGIVNFVFYHKVHNLEIATQEELDSLQEKFAYKIEDKVLYGDDEDIIEAIDIKSISSRYFLRNSEDWVSEKEISFFERKSNFESKETKIINDEIPLTKNPRRRLLMC